MTLGKPLPDNLLTSCLRGAGLRLCLRRRTAQRQRRQAERAQQGERTNGKGLAVHRHVLRPARLRGDPDEAHARQRQNRRPMHCSVGFDESDECMEVLS